MKFISTGTLRYSPKRWKPREGSSPWWLVADCDPDIGKYFRHLYHLSSHRCHKLLRSAWAEHITVIRGEEPPSELRCHWNKYSGSLVEFSVSPILQTNGTFCWLDVSCSILLDLRVELGLPRDPQYPLHLTIGHLQDEH